MRLARRAARLQQLVHCEATDAADSLGARAARHLLWLAETSLDEGLRRETETLQTCADYFDGAGAEGVRAVEAAADLQRTAAALRRSLQSEVRGGVRSRAKLAVRRRPLSALERRADAMVVERGVDGPLPPLWRDATDDDRRWLAHHGAALDGQPVGDQCPGPVSRRLMEDYRAAARA